MHAHDRLRDRRVEAFLFGGAGETAFLIGDFARAGQLDSVQIGDQFFHAIRQRIVLVSSFRSSLLSLMTDSDSLAFR